MAAKIIDLVYTCSTHFTLISRELQPPAEDLQMSVTSMSTTNPILSLDASSGITKSVPTPSGPSSMMSSGQHAHHPQSGEKSSDRMPMPNNRVVSNGGYCKEMARVLLICV